MRDPTSGPGEAPAKKCPDCLALIHAAYQKCPQCGHSFLLQEKNNLSTKAATSGIISGEVSYCDYEVKSVEYSVHCKRGAEPGSPLTMKVEYTVGFNHYISEWVCPEHSGYVRAKFECWWRNRSHLPPPKTAMDAVRLAEDGVLAMPSKIVVKSVAGEKFDRIVDYQLGPRPDYCPEPGYNDAAEFKPSEEYEEDEIPF